MKTVKYHIGLILVIGVLGACSNRNLSRLSSMELSSAVISPTSPPSLSTSTPQDVTKDKWGAYTSQKFGFSIEVPPGWEVVEPPTKEYPSILDQIWLVSEAPPPAQTGARADIVLILTREDPSPSWEPLYFENYLSQAFSIGDIQAKRISGTNKESKYAETVVLAEIGDYYLQAMPNHSEASLEYFDQVISSIRFHQIKSALPPTSTTIDQGNLEEKTILFEGISFTYPASLAEGAIAQKETAFVDPSGFMYDDHPDHIRFDFVNPYTLREPFAGFQPIWSPWLKHQNLESSEILPQIFIFPTREYAEISLLATEQIEAMKTLLDDNAPPAGGVLPVLPTFNSAQDLRAQVYPLAFQGGRGMRFIARYSQGVNPVFNPSFFYTFQGLTEDGSLYVAAFFPLYIPTLPDQIQVEDWDAFNQEYQDYMAGISSDLESLKPGDFEPDLASLDALISSITISEESTTALTNTPDTSLKPAPGPLCFVTGFSPVAFMPDGDRILIRAENGVQIFNLQTKQEEAFLEAPTSLNMPAVALSPDGKILAWALEDFSIQLIRISDKKLLHTLTGHTDLIGKLSFSPDGERLFSASHDTWFRIWDMTGNPVHAFQPTGALGYPNEVLGIGVSPDGSMLASIPYDGPVKLWDLKDYNLVRELSGTGGYDTSDIVFSPDGQLVASDTATGLFLWKTSDGTELLRGNPGINSMAVAFSPDGRFLVYGEIGEKFNVVLSSPDGAQKIRALEGHPAPIGIVFFSPDGSLLLSSDWIETRIWRVEDGQLLYIGKSACP